MTFEINQLAIKHAGHLVDAIRKKEPAIKDRDLGLFFGYVVSVHIDDAAHGRSPLFVGFFLASLGRGVKPEPGRSGVSERSDPVDPWTSGAQRQP